MFASTVADGLTTSSCSGTRPAAPAFVDRVERLLGPGTGPPGAPTAYDEESALASALAGLVRWLDWG